MNRCFSYSCWSCTNLKNGMNRWLLQVILFMNIYYQNRYWHHILFLTSIWNEFWYQYWFWVYIHYSYLIELQTELFTELNSQIGKIDELRSRIHEIDSLSRIIWLIIVNIERMRLNGIDWDGNWYWFEYYFIDCIHVTIVTR